MHDSQSDKFRGYSHAALVTELARRDDQLAGVTAELATLRELVEALEDEVRRLKKLPPRPKFKPSGLASGKGSSPSGGGGPGVV